MVFAGSVATCPQPANIKIAEHKAVNRSRVILSLPLTKLALPKRSWRGYDSTAIGFIPESGRSRMQFRSTESFTPVLSTIGNCHLIWQVNGVT